MQKHFVRMPILFSLKTVSSPFKFIEPIKIKSKLPVLESDFNFIDTPVHFDNLNFSNSSKLTLSMSLDKPHRSLSLS